MIQQYKTNQLGDSGVVKVTLESPFQSLRRN